MNDFRIERDAYGMVEWYVTPVDFEGRRYAARTPITLIEWSHNHSLTRRAFLDRKMVKERLLHNQEPRPDLY